MVYRGYIDGICNVHVCLLMVDLEFIESLCVLIALSGLGSYKYNEHTSHYFPRKKGNNKANAPETPA